jgi:NAD(P)-dependent dehydrogenase (short-subunit alcohol dehydrogenase family)
MTAGGDGMAGQRAWALGIGLDVVSGLVAGLRDQGAAVAELSDPVEIPKAEIDALAERAGPPDLVLISVLPEAAVRLAAVTDLAPADWTAQACDPLRALIRLLQALGPHVKGRGAAVALVGPSLSLIGCPQLVALTTLLEGQRGLMKSVARQWGAEGVGLNWIAVAPRALSPLFDAAPLAAKPDAVSVALGRPLDLRAEIAPILGFLASPAGRAITGATLTLDGGEWMVP